jgi:tRNA (guanine6-N2)-methyltransferase
LETFYELETVHGLKTFAEIELIKKYPKINIESNNNPTSIIFSSSEELPDLTSLKTIIAAYKYLYFDVPRPKAFLGHQHFTRIVSGINEIISSYPANNFTSFTIKAAGSESSVLKRYSRELSGAIKIPFAEDGDLLLRIKRSIIHDQGWEVLIRLSPRPSATRKWRVDNMEGALNASIASCMTYLSNPSPKDRVLNVGVGSGTILIERELHSPSSELIGIDISKRALEKAANNIYTIGMKSNIQTLIMNGKNLAFQDNYFDVIFSDLPWGQLVGDSEENKILYPMLFLESHRVIQKSGKFILLSHNIKLMEKTIFKFKDFWKLQKTFRINQGGLHPRIYLLTPIGK